MTTKHEKLTNMQIQVINFETYFYKTMERAA